MHCSDVSYCGMSHLIPAINEHGHGGMEQSIHLLHTSGSIVYFG